MHRSIAIIATELCQNLKILLNISEKIHLEKENKNICFKKTMGYKRIVENLELSDSAYL